MDRNILFLCTGNSARSQMAEALLKKYAGNEFQVFSAGTEPQEKIFPLVVQVMNEIGIDISGNKPKRLKTFLGQKHFEYVIVVCAKVDRECPAIFGNSRRLFWRFDDPAKAPGTENDILTACRRIRDQIEEKIILWLKEEKFV